MERAKCRFLCDVSGRPDTLERNSAPCRGLPGELQQSCPEVPGRLWKALRKAAAVLRAAYPCHLPAGVPPRRKTGGLIDFRYAVIINMYRRGRNTGQDTYTIFIYLAYKACTMGHF